MIQSEDVSGLVHGQLGQKILVASESIQRNDRASSMRSRSKHEIQLAVIHVVANEIQKELFLFLGGIGQHSTSALIDEGVGGILFSTLVVRAVHGRHFDHFALYGRADLTENAGEMSIDHIVDSRNGYVWVAEDGEGS